MCNCSLFTLNSNKYLTKNKNHNNKIKENQGMNKNSLSFNKMIDELYYIIFYEIINKEIQFIVIVL